MFLDTIMILRDIFQDIPTLPLKLKEQSYKNNIEVT